MLIPVTQSVSTKGQLVIPKAIRQALGIKPGTRVTLAVDRIAKVIKVQPVEPNPVKAAVGALKQKGAGGVLPRLLKEKYAEIKRGE